MIIIPQSITRVVASFSTGASSAVSVWRALESFGRENVDIVFADTQWEDADNYRFLEDCEQIYGKRVIRLVDGRTPQEVWQKRQIIPNNQIAPCTYELKLKPIQAHVKTLQARGYRVTMAIGMNPRDESRGRLESPRRNWGELGCLVEYPLLWRTPVYDAEAVVKSWGVQPPRMYQMGFEHANCKGRCPKAGVKSWRRTLTHFPDAFAGVANWERKMRQDPRFAAHSILTRQRNGKTETLTLDEVRAETNAADNYTLRLFAFDDDLQSTCGVECGIG